MMPYNIQRSDFSAVYFVRKRSHLGVFYGAIDSATRTRLQTNAGVLIRVVVDATPASRADILPGDIILTIDGERVDGPEALNNQLKGRLGREVVFGIDRNGTHIEKRVTPDA
jgi:S1-C subfamily serine protease